VIGNPAIKVKRDPDRPAPKTPELIDRELARGRLEQKLDATRNRIADWQKTLQTCREDPAGQVTRRWMEGLIHHWQEKAQNLEKRLRQLDPEERKPEDPGECPRKGETPMRITVTWTAKDGSKSTGDLTKDELPPTADRSPLVLDHDGRAYAPNELGTITATCRKTASNESLIQEARRKGYRIDWRPGI
jgi:hypothetical protein